VSQKFEIFEDEIARRTKDLIRSQKILSKESLSLQKRVGDAVSSKELEMATDLLRTELEEQILKLREEQNLLRNIQKSSKYEIEAEIIKKIKSMQSE
jgi:hypothetical protein